MKIETIRHSLSHILASAVQKLYPKVKFGIGPAIENGFYYDFDLNQKITPEDLPKIEKEMKKIIEKGTSFKKKEISEKEANKIFKEQPYKLDLIKEIKAKKITIYRSGNFIDLCEGPHLRSTKQVPKNAFSLTKIAGAYWKGNEKNPMLTRIYGVAFKSKKELNKYFKKQKEAKKRDHRKLGKKLDLFLFDQEIGAGLPLWTPKGTVIRKNIEDYLREELKSQEYKWVTTPHLGKLKLWKTSGHWDLYRENMYSPIDIEGQKYEIKPMNCPFHVKIYKSKIRSYKDLPLKYAEFGTVYRYEKSGVLHGLTRVRGFTQDDAHIWCTPAQLSQELTKLLRHGLKILKTFGFQDFSIFLSTRPEKYAGSIKKWKKATRTLKYVLEELNLDYKIDPGEGVFYGPKIDIKIKDSLGRDWQCTTIQVDFNLPQRFEINYVNKNGNKKEPYMIHRALVGSLERFIGVLLEHYKGSLPLWLSPTQIWIIPVGAKHRKYAKRITKQLQEKDLRVKSKTESETVSKKIREGEIQKIPYLLVVGDKEIKSDSVRVRDRFKGDLGKMKTDNFIKKVKKEIKQKKNPEI